MNYLYNVKVSSRTIAYYKIEVKHLLSIFQDEPICFFDFKKECFKKINLLLERLTDLNITKIEMIDDKETIRVKSLDKELENEKKLNNKVFDLEYGEVNYNKQKIQLKNQMNKKFDLKKDRSLIRKISTKWSHILKVLTKLNFSNLKQNLKSLSPLPVINNYNKTNLINKKNTLQETKKNFNHGLKFEKNLIKKLEKQKEEDDKLLITNHYKNPSSSSLKRIFNDDVKINNDYKTIFFKTSIQIKIKPLIRNRNNNTYDKLKRIKSWDFEKENKIYEQYANTIVNEEPYIASYSFRGQKGYNGKYLKNKNNFYRKYKSKMTSEDLFKYRKEEMKI